MSLDFDFLILVVPENESFSGNMGFSSSSSSRPPARNPSGIEEGLFNIAEFEELEEEGATSRVNMTETEEEVFSSDVNIEVHANPDPPLEPTIVQMVSFFLFLIFIIPNFSLF